MTEGSGARADEVQDAPPCRSITVTRLTDGTAVMDVGDTRVVLNETEFEKLSLLMALPPAAKKPPTPGQSTVLDALALAKRELVFAGGCVMTDRPDLPLSSETSWTLDVTRVLAAIDDAVEQLEGAARRTGPECTGCSSCPPTRPISALTKFALGPLGSRMPDQESL